MFVDNNWYGQRSILAKYCNVNDFHTFAAIQHGMLTRVQEELLGKRRFSIIPYLCWNERVLNKLKDKGLKNIPSQWIKKTLPAKNIIKHL